MVEYFIFQNLSPPNFIIQNQILYLHELFKNIRIDYEKEYNKRTI